ncbi:prepilin-type N-terminal cleavage/methylation domain-containing protein [Haloferula sp. BvORR071]|uniref:prepilin-type N-terminal cleavage/methylation domain-containing protein n=1 Tax=Haloferula sp. BvORR071 TaxID=1396141 RepID=UPI00054D37EA|nr:prepilin-type N-terminal cleavage/methylation domain-containing protein [Haloferula sp. BvORR071]
MKLTNTSRRANKGMTLLELTVVILVLLSLISILFVGARAWKKGSDRAANIMNIRNVQQAVRAHQNMQGLLEGAALADTVIFGSGPATEGYLKRPTPPASTLTYTYGTTVPAIGTLYLAVTGTNAADYAPATGTYADW